MKTKFVTLFALVLGLLMVSGPLLAHHGNVAYQSKPIVLKNATVTKFVWANPHTLILFDVKDDNGNVVHWASEAGSPSALTPFGWTRDSVKPGDVLTIVMYQSQAGTPVGRTNRIITSDGKMLCDKACKDTASTY